MSNRKTKTTEIEIGDFVEVVASDDKHWVGMVGVFDNHWQGKFVVVDADNGDEFTYATEIKFYKKSA